MIIVKLQGGLGNQMFQYALGRNLSIKNNASLKLDLTSLKENNPNITKRDYNLSVFNIKESLATKEEIDWFKKYCFKRGKFWFWYNRIIASRSRYAWEEQFNFEPWILTLKDPVYLDGWWQTERYFKNIETDLREELVLKEPLSDYSQKIFEKINNAVAVSIHVRRGDYVTNKSTYAYHGTCSMHYYGEAIRHIIQKEPSASFFIFSDDYDWAVENFKSLPYPITCVKNSAEKNYEDLVLMASCKHNIIANSSFSWWGAWLNTNPGKMVVAPRKWFQTPKMDTRDLLPDTWIKL